MIGAGWLLGLEGSHLKCRTLLHQLGLLVLVPSEVDSVADVTGAGSEAETAGALAATGADSVAGAGISTAGAGV